MKKVLITLTVLVVLACSLIVTAAAADYEHIADDLKELGLFKGSDSGYELDRAPNRGEGLVMLIRLLGLEEDALGFGAGSPFSDVPGWLAPYVSFAYSNGLAKGVSDTEFNPGGLCDARMFTTFVLRALGYSDENGGQFTYAGAIDFGKRIGIISDELAAEAFLRDHMIAVSYLALMAAPEGGSHASLLAKLAESGAVAQSSAAAMAGRWAAMGDLNSVFTALLEDASFAAGLTVSTDMGTMGAILAGMGMNLNIGVDADMSLQLGEDNRAAIHIASSIMGNDSEVNLYLSDGSIYIQNGEEKSRIDFVAVEGAASGMFDVNAIIDRLLGSDFTLSPFYFRDLSKGSEGDLSVFSIKLPDAMLDSAMGMLSGLSGVLNIGNLIPGDFDLSSLDLSFGIASIKIFVDADGALNSAAITVEVTFKPNMGALSLPITVKLNIGLEVTAVGADVTVDLPDDLDSYSLRYFDNIPLG